MTPINHALWFPLRESSGSFPHSLLSTSKFSGSLRFIRNQGIGAGQTLYLFPETPAKQAKSWLVLRKQVILSIAHVHDEFSSRGLQAWALRLDICQATIKAPMVATALHLVARVTCWAITGTGSGDAVSKIKRQRACSCPARRPFLAQNTCFKLYAKLKARSRLSTYFQIDQSQTVDLGFSKLGV